METPTLLLVKKIHTNIKHMYNPFKRKKSWYKVYKKSFWPVVVDVSLIFIVLALIVIFISLKMFNPENFITNSNNNTNNKPSVSYQIDVNNLPLEINYHYKDSYLNRENPQSSIEIELENKSDFDISDIKISFSDSNINSIEIDKIEKKETIKKEIVFDNLNIDNKVLVINLNSDIEYKINEQEIKTSENLPSLNLNASLYVEAFALYTSHDGETLGLGPIPPIVGLPTNYWIFIEIEPLGNVSNFVLSAKLPKNVSYYDNYALLSGNLNYNEDNRQIIWKIEDILDDDSSVYRLGIEVQLIPEENQSGQIADLLTNILYYFQDTVSLDEISSDLPNVNTGLEKDRYNSNEGIIQED